MKHKKNLSVDNEITQNQLKELSKISLKQSFQKAFQLEHAVVIAINKREDNMHNPYKALWTVTISDAKQICSDNRTEGLSHFLGYFALNDIENLQHFKFIDDNGMYNDILRNLDVVIYQSKKLGYDYPELIAP